MRRAASILLALIRRAAWLLGVVLLAIGADLVMWAAPPEGLDIE